MSWTVYRALPFVVPWRDTVAMAGLNVHEDREADPITVPMIDEARAARARKDIPVWVRLTFDDGRPERTERGFAVAWTDQDVRVQVLWQETYYKAAREFWVRAEQVKRRTIGPRLLGVEPAPVLYGG